MMPLQPPHDPLSSLEGTTPIPLPASYPVPVSGPRDLLLPLDTAPSIPIEPRSTSSSAKAEKLAQRKAQHALAKDDPAFTDFYERYRRPIYSFVLQSIRDIEDTHEIVQDVFEAASRSWRKLRTLGEKAQQSWLYTTARRKTCDCFRRLKRRIRHWTQYKELLVEERQGPRFLDDSSGETGRVWEIMANLSKRERECLVLHSEGWSSAEIAEVLKVEESSVRSYIARGKRKYIEVNREMNVASDRERSV